MGSPLYTNSIWKILAKLDFRQLFIELYQAMSDKIEHLPFELSPNVFVCGLLVGGDLAIIKYSW